MVGTHAKMRNANIAWLILACKPSTFDSRRSITLDLSCGARDQHSMLKETNKVLENSLSLGQLQGFVMPRLSEEAEIYEPTIGACPGKPGMSRISFENP